MFRFLRPRPQAFASPALRFLLHLAVFPSLDPDRQARLVKGVNWQQLQDYPVLLPYVHHFLLRPKSPMQGVEVPQTIKTQAKARYLENIANNEQRLTYVLELCEGFRQLNADAVFVKGVAEIAMFYRHSAFLAQRPLADIDVLCRPADLQKVDAYLTANGYQFHDYGLQMDSPELLKQKCLDMVGHYVYNLNRLNHLELHPGVATGTNRNSYPKHFEERLFNRCAPVLVRNIPVRVPSPDDLLVYFICHAAGLKDHHAAVLHKTLPWDPPAERLPERRRELIHQRLDVHQLLYVFKLFNLLQALNGQINLRDITDQLLQVNNRQWIAHYLSLAKYAIPGFPLQARPLTLKQLAGERHILVEDLLAPQK